MTGSEVETEEPDRELRLALCSRPPVAMDDIPHQGEYRPTKCPSCGKLRTISVKKGTRCTCGRWYNARRYEVTEAGS